jgi:hypothetical protein
MRQGRAGAYHRRVKQGVSASARASAVVVRAHGTADRLTAIGLASGAAAA